MYIHIYIYTFVIYLYVFECVRYVYHSVSAFVWECVIYTHRKWTKVFIPPSKLYKNSC